MELLLPTYGDGRDWNALSEGEQVAMPPRFEAIRARGALAAAADPIGAVVSGLDGTPCPCARCEIEIRPTAEMGGARARDVRAREGP